MVSDVLRFGETRQLGQRERRDNLEDRNTRFAAGEIITMRVRRSSGAGLSEFRIPYRKWMRVLDALNWIAEDEAPDLAEFAWIAAEREMQPHETRVAGVCLGRRRSVECRVPGRRGHRRRKTKGEQRQIVVRRAVTAMHGLGHFQRGDDFVRMPDLAP